MNYKRLLISLLAITSAVLVTSVATTVAWFRGSSYLEYNNIQIGLADKNINISPDNVDWYASLNNDDLHAVDKFRPVTSMYSDQWIESKEKTPQFRQGYGAPVSRFENNPDDVLLATEGFFSQALYLKSDNDVYLTIDTEKTTFLADTKKNKDVADSLALKYPELTKEEILTNLNKIQDSLRMSLLILNNDGSPSLRDYQYYIIDPHKEQETLFGGVLDNDEDTYYDDVDGYEVVYGDVSNTDKAVYDEPDSYGTELVGQPSVFNAKTKANVHHFNLEKSLENGFTIAKENSIALEESQDKVFIPLTANVSKKVIVSFYLEGWDLDNTNVTMYSNFIINVSFMIAKTHAE